MDNLGYNNMEFVDLKREVSIKEEFLENPIEDISSSTTECLSPQMQNFKQENIKLVSAMC